MKHGIRDPNRCYLGSFSKSLINLINASKTRSDILEGSLTEELEDIKTRKNILDEINDSSYATLIARIIQLSQKLKPGWSSEKHYLIKQANCVYCKKKLSVRFVRIGNNPDYTEGKYNIEKLDIKKGKKSLTSYFGNKNPLHKGWMDGIHTSSSKLDFETHTKDIDTVQEKIHETLRLKILNHIVHDRS